MGKITEIPLADFSVRRQGIPAIPVNNVPPVAEGIHPYMPRKFDDPTGTIIDPWGDASTDFKQLTNYGEPTYAAAGSVAMGLKPVLIWPGLPALRIVMKQVVNFAAKKFSFHIAYTVDGVMGGSGNRCAFSFVDSVRSKYLAFYATSSSAGPPRIVHGAGNPGDVNPLGSNSLATTARDITFASPILAAAQKEILTIQYDATVGGGTITVYRNGNPTPINTFSAVGIYALEGDFYLGADARSATNASDFKGELGYFIIDENVRTTSEITAIYNFLNAALQ